MHNSLGLGFLGGAGFRPSTVLQSNPKGYKVTPRVFWYLLRMAWVHTTKGPSELLGSSRGKRHLGFATLAGLTPRTGDL